MFLPILDKWKKGKPKNRSKKFHTSPIKFGYKLSDLKFWDLDPHIIPMVQKLSISYDHFKMACSADGDKLTKKLKKSKISKKRSIAGEFWIVTACDAYDNGWYGHVIFLVESGYEVFQYIVEIDREPP